MKYSNSILKKIEETKLSKLLPQVKSIYILCFKSSEMVIVSLHVFIERCTLVSIICIFPLELCHPLFCVPFLWNNYGNASSKYITQACFLLLMGFIFLVFVALGGGWSSTSSLNIDYVFHIWYDWNSWSKLPFLVISICLINEHENLEHFGYTKFLVR